MKAESIIQLYFNGDKDKARKLAKRVKRQTLYNCLRRASDFGKSHEEAVEVLMDLRPEELCFD